MKQPIRCRACRQQAGKRTFLRRTKPTPAPEATEPETTTTDDTKSSKRGSSRFKSENARNVTSAGNVNRPSFGAGARRSERPPTRNFARRRLGGANGTTTTIAPPSSSSSSTSSSTTRRPFRIASRRRPNPVTTTSSTTTKVTNTKVTTQATTLAPESDESLQDIGDIDAFEDPSLESRAAKKPQKTPRRPLVNLKEDLKDQNPSATNEDESKRQSKKYSASIKQNQLDSLLKAKSGEVTTQISTTLEEYNAETALALATHQLLTAPLPGYTETDYEQDTKPARPKTTNRYTSETNTPTYEGYSTTYRIGSTKSDSIQLLEDSIRYDTPRITTVYDETKTPANLKPYTAVYESKTNYDDVSRQADSEIDIDTGKLTAFVSTDTFPTTARQGFTNPTDYETRVTPTAYVVPKQSGTLRRYPTTQVYQTVTNQFVTTTQGYTGSSPSGFSTVQPLLTVSQGFSSPNIITPGYSGVQRGDTKYLINENYVTTSEDPGFTRYRGSSSQEPSYFTRELLLESPVTKTYNDEYQYFSPTTPQTTTRKVYRKKIQRRISTTQRPTTKVPEVTTPKSTRVPSKPFEKEVKKLQNAPAPVVNYYSKYNDGGEKVVLKYAEGTKVILHGKGSIECLDVGNFPHPSSCKKFISCARMEFGSLLGWEYVCPKGLSFDPVGGICNWSAGLGCEEDI